MKKWIKEKWDYFYLELWYNFTRDFIDPWYHPVKSIFFPHNIQKIRNVPRTWTDRCNSSFHMIFSMFCDYVEKEIYCYATKTYGRDGLVARIDDNKDKDGWYEVEKEMLYLYDWYTQKNWKDPYYGMSYLQTRENSNKYFDEQLKFEEECQENLVRLVKTRQYWWS